MKKIAIFLALLIPVSASAAQIDPLWRLQREMKRPSADVGDALGIKRGLASEEEALIEVLVKTTDTALTVERIRGCGGKIGTITRTIITASLPAFVLEGEAEGWTEAEYIEASMPMSPHNDLANDYTDVITAQKGTDLPYGYDGTGVIIGIIDSGIDLEHPAFKSESGKTRILYLWDQNIDSNSHLAEIENSYGTEYTQAEIDAGEASAHKDEDGHGTHVAGTAGGRDSAYSGVAPKASFIIVKRKSAESEQDYIDNITFSTFVVDAANYIFQKAEELGMPAVINMSLGSEFGARDGTSLAETVFNELVDGSSGRSIVASAGNSGKTTLIDPYNEDYEYNVYNHISYSITNLDGSLFKIYDSPAVIDIWKAEDCNIKINVGLWELSDDSPTSSDFKSATGWISPGDPKSGSLSDIVDYEITNSDTVEPYNNKSRAYVVLRPKDSSIFKSYYFDIVFQPVSDTCTSFNAWTFPYNGTYLSWYNEIMERGGEDVQYHSGDNNSTVEIPSTAANIISVGAFTTRKSWTDIDRNPQSEDEELRKIASFSSRGPAIDEATQGTKPNITAPGAYLISAKSADSNPEPEKKYIIDDEHLIMAGTSMSSPHVAGIVALMLQAYPSLTYRQIMDYLQNTASADSYVGDAPNDDWGYGKINAFAAVKAVVDDYPPNDDPEITVFGITAGTTEADYTIDKIAVNFPRPIDGVSINDKNLYMRRLTDGSQLSQSSTWTPAPCDPGDAISSSIALSDSQTAEITLDEPLSLGDFTICLTPNVRDADGDTFWGKTVQFGTTLPNDGCSLIIAKETRSQTHAPLFILAAILSLLGIKTLLGKRKRI